MRLCCRVSAWWLCCPPVTEAARLPHVCPMALGYSCLPCCDNDDSLTAQRVRASETPGAKSCAPMCIRLWLLRCHGWYEVCGAWRWRQLRRGVRGSFVWGGRTFSSVPSRSLLLKLSMQSVKHFSTRLLYMRRLHAQKCFVRRSAHHHHTCHHRFGV